MIIKTVPTAKIKPAAYNPRKSLKPGEPEFEKLRRSLGEFGLVEPLVWNKRTGNLVGGHQRFAVLISEGAQAVEVSVVDLSLEKEKALNLALNKIQGEWDQDKLAALLDELTKESSLDLDLTGFGQPEADAIIAEFLDRQSYNGNDSNFNVDAELERIKKVGKTVTKPGDLTGPITPHRSRWRCSKSRCCSTRGRARSATSRLPARARRSSQRRSSSAAAAPSRSARSTAT